MNSSISSPIKAWFSAGLLAGKIALILAALVLFITDDGSGCFSGVIPALLILAICVAFHFFGYVIVGIPFFMFFWSRNTSKVWLIKFAIPVGFILGYLAMLIMLSSLFDYNSEILVVSLWGGAYGSLTAFCSALIFKKSNAQTALHRSCNVE